MSDRELGLRSKHVRGKAALQAIIRRYAVKENVPVQLAYAVAMIESNYRTHVTGPYGSVGLMQIKYSTARGLGYRGTRQELYYPEVNVKYAMKYLAGAFRRAKGDICGTVWRYNAGYYAKRMNPISARYCRRTIAFMGRKYVSPKSVVVKNRADRAARIAAATLVRKAKRRSGQTRISFIREMMPVLGHARKKVPGPLVGPIDRANARVGTGPIDAPVNKSHYEGLHAGRVRLSNLIGQ